MAKLRIFVSSTYFDLKVIRSELWRFIVEHGYDPVEHEQNQIPWGESKKLEEYCYDEIALCDMLISVVGGRFGAQATDQDNASISQAELKAAQKLGKQVYIFVERDILAEHRTWRLNRDNFETKYAAVDNPRIYDFLEQMYALPRNNPIFPFITGDDVTRALKEQWAGLFQRLLAKESEESQRQLLFELRTTANELKSALQDVQRSVNRLMAVPSSRNIPRSALPGALKEALDLTYSPELLTLTDMESLLAEHGLVFRRSAERPGEVFRLYSSPTRNLLLSNQLWTADGQLLEIDASQWNMRYIMRLPAGTEAIPEPPKPRTM